MPIITLKESGKQISCSAGDNLLAVLVKNGVFVDNPCNGKGTCGKCRVKVNGQICLACQTEVTQELEIELLHEERPHQILTTGYIPDFEMDAKTTGYGIAVDIGTTTVVLSLVRMEDGRELAETSMINPQKKYGLDVLTRITYECEHPDTGSRELQETIVQSLNQMIETVCKEAAVPRNEIREITVAANCTMMHMLLGVDARSIGKAPYHPVFTGKKELPAKEIGLEAGPDTILYCLPGVSAYIGADIVAGAYVCGLHKSTKHTLFIDIGTNGEIVLAVKDRLFCCSCAAGPALEGMNISCGMRASDGAVEDVRITEHGVAVKVIGNREAQGICGSGILAAVRELIRAGLVKKSGVFEKPEKLGCEDYRYPMLRLNGTKREFLLNAKQGLFLTQHDIRQVQLAKGAILSGFQVLLGTAGIEMHDLEQVLIAGQFGAYLPKDSITGIGILPKEIENKLTYVGNSSRTGAYMALMSGRVKLELEKLADRMEYMELAETGNYDRIFAESMIFPNV